jgi:OOP family OmpA-OmpF porin
MPRIPTKSAFLAAGALLAATLPFAAQAQQEQLPPNAPIVVEGQLPPLSEMVEGPEIKGVITARRGNRIGVTLADGTDRIIALTEATEIRGGGGLFGGRRGNHTAASLLNGLPVTVRTLQAGEILVARRVSFKGGDFRTASMIRNATAQGFAEQTAATEALRGRVANIDQYNIRNTTNVYFDTGMANLTDQYKAELCATASAAQEVDNALLLVVGYTDAQGNEEYNQALSERRAARVINHLQQACRWQPYRMLTPTGMAESDPAASNDTPEGMALNRRVAVNVLVSKAVDGF